MAINATGQGVRVHGLAELNRAMKAIGPDARRDLKKTNLKVAQFVADDARAAAFSLGGVAAKTAPSITAAGRVASAGVSFGGGSYPFAMGAEFGSYRFHQFKPWRGNGSDAGYFVYPAIRNDVDRIESEYSGAIDSLMRKHGLL